MSWRREEYGRTQLGAPLEVYLPENPVQTLVVGALHGEEPESAWVLARLMDQVPAADSHAAIVLCVNPDGMQRAHRGNANGVDLNRNFPSPTWHEHEVRMFPAGTPLVDELRTEIARTVTWGSGKAPLDQPESAALVDLVAQLDPKFLVNVHTPLHRLSWSGPPLGALGAHLAELSGLPLVVEDLIPDDTMPPGSLRSWFSATYERPCLTWELPFAPLTHLKQTQLPALKLLTQPLPGS
jgi:protein MpaA